MKKDRYALISERVAYKYQDIGHGAGDIIWWEDNSGKVRSVTSTGTESHHELSRLDLDLRWRGMLGQSGTATLLPPIRLYSRYDAEDIPFPDAVMRALERMGAKRFYMDTRRGMVRIGRRRK